MIGQGRQVIKRGHRSKHTCTRLFSSARAQPTSPARAMKEAMEKESNPTQEAVQPETYSVRRINRIAKHIAARSYLEVGVARGLTFNQLAFERKVAVDPAFRFDVADYKKEGVEFCQETSDRFFSRQDVLRKFDLIFLDGLHTFQQTFR